MVDRELVDRVSDRVMGRLLRALRLFADPGAASCGHFGGTGAGDRWLRVCAVHPDIVRCDDCYRGHASSHSLECDTCGLSIGAGGVMDPVVMAPWEFDLPSGRVVLRRVIHCALMKCEFAGCDEAVIAIAPRVAAQAELFTSALR